MKVAVLGLWHLGSVTAACIASAGHDVVAWDPDPARVMALSAGRAPVAESGLHELLSEVLAARRLLFSADLVTAVGDADIIWVAFDTPVDDADRADVESVIAHVCAALPHAKDGALVLMSSQLPVGTSARIEREAAAVAAGRRLSVACCPENLRLGRAIDVFMHPDRVVAGVRSRGDRETIARLFASITSRIEWMSVESAEMTKHAINAYLATSVAFINEVAVICERSGADAKDVERGLKTDARIGPGAYLSPGGAFAGGTLARDLTLLAAKAEEFGLRVPLLDGVQESNRIHALWSYRTVIATVAPVANRRIAVWGLTYKPGTDTLRRSLSVELCRMLVREGASVAVFDPLVRKLPEEISGIEMCADPISAATLADAVVVGTPWPLFREVTAEALLAVSPRATVIDPGRFLHTTLGSDPRVRYVSVGTPGS
jgi:UDPglucose 6-dehydrogenase